MPGVKINNPIWDRFRRKETSTPSKPKESLPTPTTSPVDQWARQPITRTEAMQRLGVDEKSGNSKILESFEPSRFATVRLASVKGKVVWANPELARELGFPVSLSNKMDERLEQALLEKLSFRILPYDVEVPDGAKTLTGYADRYGGFGIGYNEGSGRAAFLPYGNLNIKGIGQTPLSKTKNDFHHSHGGAPMREGFLEAIWGEVGTNLFTEGSTRILAIIDTGDYTEWEDGSKERRALIVRAGDQIRPAHFLDDGMTRGEMTKMFIESTRATGDLVESNSRNGPRPDIHKTFENIVKKHANTVAEQLRFRILHGAPSPSNMELDGSQLDLATMQSQPRTAPISSIEGRDWKGYTFGSEHLSHIGALSEVSNALRAHASKKEINQYNIRDLDVFKTFNSAYQSALAYQFACATGLKGEVVEDIQGGTSKAAERFRNVIVKMMKKTNKGSIDADKNVVSEVSVLDVFGALGKMPGISLDAPDRLRAVQAAFSPVIKIKDKLKRVNMEREIRQLVKEFDQAYQDLMSEAEKLTDKHYDDIPAMKRSIAHRARFENKPMDLLYRAQLSHNLDQAIEWYENSNDPAVFKQAVDITISNSIRNVDALRASGENSVKGTTVLSQKRTVNGVNYSVKAKKGGERKLVVKLQARKIDFDRYELAIPGNPQLTLEQLKALKYRYTTDGWENSQELSCSAKAFSRAVDCEFEIPVLRGETGHLEGLFHCNVNGDFWLKDGSNDFHGYNFVVPDEKERETLLSSLKPSLPN